MSLSKKTRKIVSREGLHDQWQVTKTLPVSFTVGLYFFPLVTFYEDDMLPFLPKSPNIRTG